MQLGDMIDGIVQWLTTSVHGLQAVNLLDKGSDVITKVLYLKLRNQMGSQKQSYSKGFEPFITPYGEQNFCLQDFTFPIPVLYFPAGAGHPIVKLERRHAALLDHPRVRTLEYEELRLEAERFKWECKVRRRLTSEAFGVAVDLLLPASYRNVATPPPGDALAHHCERLLARADVQLLIDLAGLLGMPDGFPSEFAIAA